MCFTKLRTFRIKYIKVKKYVNLKTLICTSKYKAPSADRGWKHWKILKITIKVIEMLDKILNPNEISVISQPIKSNHHINRFYPISTSQ